MEGFASGIGDYYASPGILCEHGDCGKGYSLTGSRMQPRMDFGKPSSLIMVKIKFLYCFPKFHSKYLRGCAYEKILECGLMLPLNNTRIILSRQTLGPFLHAKSTPGNSRAFCSGNIPSDHARQSFLPFAHFPSKIMCFSRFTKSYDMKVKFKALTRSSLVDYQSMEALRTN
jgi:hypothetical protein